MVGSGEQEKKVFSSSQDHTKVPLGFQLNQNVGHVSTVYVVTCITGNGMMTGENGQYAGCMSYNVVGKLHAANITLRIYVGRYICR